jgi:hypothetical protein
VGRGRTLAEFQKEFPDEVSCAAFLSVRRWPDGFVCPACGGSRSVALKSRPRLEPPHLLVAEALGAGHVSRPAAQACRRLSR